MELYVKISFISIFSLFFPVFKHDFIRCVLMLPLSQLQTQQVMTSQHRIFNTYLLYSCAHIFVIELYGKSSQNGGF